MYIIPIPDLLFVRIGKSKNKSQTQQPHLTICAQIIIVKADIKKKIL